jgi:hypothetical protein
VALVPARGAEAAGVAAAGTTEVARVVAVDPPSAKAPPGLLGTAAAGAEAAAVLAATGATEAGEPELEFVEPDDDPPVAVPGELVPDWQPEPTGAASL